MYRRSTLLLRTHLTSTIRMGDNSSCWTDNFWEKKKLVKNEVGTGFPKFVKGSSDFFKSKKFH